MLENAIIRKDNRIVSACYQLTLNEQRLILTAIAKVKYGEKIPFDIDITAHEFLKTFPDVGEQNVHEALNEAVNRLFDRKIRVENPIEINEFRWIDGKTTYKKRESRIKFSFSRQIIPYLEDLQQKFTKYRLGDVCSLKSIHSIRIFEMLTQFENTGYLLLEVDKFKERMGIAEKYTDFSDMKRRVIDVAIKELNSKSTLNISYKIERVGRTANKIAFTFSQR